MHIFQPSLFKPPYLSFFADTKHAVQGTVVGKARRQVWMRGWKGIKKPILTHIHAVSSAATILGPTLFHSLTNRLEELLETRHWTSQAALPWLGHAHLSYRTATGHTTSSTRPQREGLLVGMVLGSMFYVGYGTCSQNYLNQWKIFKWPTTWFSYSLQHTGIQKQYSTLTVFLSMEDYYNSNFSQGWSWSRQDIVL